MTAGKAEKMAVTRRGVRRLSNASDIRSLDKNRLQFLSAFLCVLCASALISSGCSVTRGVRNADGTLTVSNWRLLWRSEAVRFETNATNFNARLIIGKSASDDASVGAVTEGAVKAILHTP